MNDTVVVYDRIRENLGKHRGKSFAQIINLSVSETLSRTILTSGATMLSVLAFFVYGTGVIKDFMLALVVGIVAGTYSSIYVAAPLTEWIDTRMTKKKRSVAPRELARRLNAADDFARTDGPRSIDAEGALVWMRPDAARAAPRQ
jgi:preprotein translocase subunit SecF